MVFRFYGGYIVNGEILRLGKRELLLLLSLVIFFLGIVEGQEGEKEKEIKREIVINYRWYYCKYRKFIRFCR